jgi:hypothetical protein
MTFISYSMTLYVDDAGTGSGSGANTQVAKVRSISEFPFGEINWVRTPTLDQSSRLMPYTAGLTEPGDVKLELEYTHAGLSRMQLLLGVQHTWQIGFLQDTYKAQFTGTLGMVSVKPGGPEDVTSIEVSIKVQSVPSVTTGAPSMAMGLTGDDEMDAEAIREHTGRN